MKTKGIYRYEPAAPSDTGGASVHDRLDHLAADQGQQFAATQAHLAVLEERMKHLATKSWVLGGVVAVLSSIVGGLWWVVQQYLAPLLHAAIGGGPG
jgi:hypothetical protein